MKMAKLTPLANQGKMLDRKTNVGIGISRGELVLVAKDKIERGQKCKKLMN